MLSSQQRREFDMLLERIIEQLPDDLRRLLEEVPVIVEDEPPRELLSELGLEPRRSVLCGLHWGVPLTARSVEHSGGLPDQIRLFREPIMWVAGRDRPIRGGSLASSRRRRERGNRLEQQIRITLLHEIGHHFGLDEADLAELGYG